MEKMMQLESIEFTDYSKYPLEQISGKAGTFQRVIARADDWVGIPYCGMGSGNLDNAF